MSTGKLADLQQQLRDLNIPFDEKAPYVVLKSILDKATGKSKATEDPGDEQQGPQGVSEAPIVDSRDEAMAILQKQVAETQALLAQLIKERGNQQVPVHGSVSNDDLLKLLQRAADGRTNEYGLLNADYIPSDDLLEKPITYYMTGPTRNIWGKQIGNNWTLPPLGHKFLKFDMKIGYTTRSGDGIKQRRISTFVCMSSTLSKWIESLPEFGRSIYRNMELALDSSQDTSMIDAFNRHYAMLQGMDFSKLTKMAHEQYQIPTSMNADHSYYASRIAEIRAKQEIEQQRARFEDAMRAQGVQSMIATPA